ncbi:MULTISPECIES: HNH/endonuclease VII fold putative polymorphic toxin [Enterobacterales]|uniref:HNH/endonuclease VII fold putative polymorphic toxin n=1 Tax=Enterobacterales TaxID=91347 RepID=UPI002ED8F7E7
MGGVNPYGYVSNPLKWIDPLGLACCPPKYPSRNAALRDAKRDAGIPMGQQPSKVEMVNLTDRNGHNILGNDYQPIKTREYTFTRPGKEDIVIQDHSPGHIYGPEGTPGNKGPHINVRPKSDTRNGHIDGTQEHYPF